MKPECMLNAALKLAASAALALALAWPAQGGQNSISSQGANPEALAQRRVQLLVKAGRGGLKPVAGEINQLAVDSEECRAAFGAKACGLSSDPLPGGSEEQVFAYYVKQPIELALNSRHLEVYKEDWQWNPYKISSTRTKSVL